MKHALHEIFLRRHACHLFQEGRPIAPEDLEFILEAGRLSPSSFGLEPWKFVVIQTPHLKQAMQAACFQQPQVGSASVIVVLLARLAELAPDSDYVRRLLAREYPGPKLDMALANYRGFFTSTDIRAWAVTQCHIAAANMMTAAMAAGIDSCAIGGFSASEIQALLHLAPGQYEVALVLTFGYCAEPPPSEKLRLPLSELVDYR